LLLGRNCRQQQLLHVLIYDLLLMLNQLNQLRSSFRVRQISLNTSIYFSVHYATDTTTTTTTTTTNNNNENSRKQTYATQISEAFTYLHQ